MTTARNMITTGIEIPRKEPFPKVVKASISMFGQLSA